MLALAIEQSGLIGSVAIIEVGQKVALESAGKDGANPESMLNPDGLRVLAEGCTPAGQRSARTLIPTIRDTVKSAAVSFDAIDLIAVTNGPGSFTSLRIGVTSAKLLAWMCDAKLVGINTLRAIAMRSGPGKVHAVMDAQRQQLFAATFSIDETWDEQSNGGVIDRVATAVDPTRIVSRSDWIAGLPAQALAAGDGLQKIAAEVRQARPDVRITDQELWRPSAVDVAILAIHDVQNGITDDVFGLLPDYFRESAAEEKKHAVENSTAAE